MPVSLEKEPQVTSLEIQQIPAHTAEGVGHVAVGSEFDAAVEGSDPSQELTGEGIDTLEAASGSLAPTWKERSISAEQVVPPRDILPAHGQYGHTIEDVGYQRGYKINKVPVAFPINPRDTQTIQYRDIGEMDAEERNMHGISSERTDGSAEFDQLNPDTKQALFSARILEIESESRDLQERQKAIQKNLQRLESGIVVKPTDYVHGFSSEMTRNILKTGLVAGEGVGHINGKAPIHDTFPYNLDLYDAQAIGAAGEEGKLDLDHTGQYGDVVAIVDRTDSTIGKDDEIELYEDHKLIFGGLPATDIRALHLRSSESREALEKTVNAVVAEGIYIPVYESSGDLALSYEDYASKRASKDYVDNFANEPDKQIQYVDMRRKQPESTESKPASAPPVVM